jgi:isopropylmalate/homocitrate/citramalate synthase
MPTQVKIASQERRFHIVVPSQLAQQFITWAENLNVSLSELARDAMLEKVRRLEREKIEREIAEELMRYAEQDRRTAEEWAFTDATS